MKTRKLATFLIAGSLLSVMAWSFGTQAAGENRMLPSASGVNQSTNEPALTAPAQDEEDQYVDADLGKFNREIDREKYIRQRGEYFARRRGIEPGRPHDPGARGRAIDQMERQEKGRLIETIVNGGIPSPIGPDVAWTPLGPGETAALTNGQALSGGNINVTGRTTAVVVDPTNPNKVYIGTAQGGVWRSLDGGTTWQTIFDGAQSLAIGAMALAPSDRTKLYVGTGEVHQCGDCFFGVGLYRIDDVDTTATLVGPINPLVATGIPGTTAFTGRGITQILVHPGDPATIFVTTGRGVGGSGVNALDAFVPPLAIRGLYRSTDATSAAPTFTKLTVTSAGSVGADTSGNRDMFDAVFEPGNPNNLLCTVLGLTAGPNDGGIYRTTNALAATPTFTQVLSLASGVRTNLTINKVGSVVTAYAATSEPASGTSCTSTTQFGAVRKQIDPFNISDTWSTKLMGGGGFCGGQCFYNIAIAVNPNNANEVYLGGNARGSCSDGMKKSTDGGATFSGQLNPPRDDVGLHADTHAIFYDTAGNVYTGNDGGIWKRNSSAAAGTAWTNLNGAPLNTLQFESIAVHPTDRFLTIGGTQDNGTEYQQTSSGNWSNTEGGDGGYALIDQSATNTTNVTMYHTFFNATGSQIGFDRINLTSCLPCKNSWASRGAGALSSGLVPLCDGTLSSTACDGTPAAAPNGINLSDNVLFYAPMALGPGAPNTVYFGTNRLYRSSDRGDTMQIVSQSPIAGTSPISTIAIWPQGDNIRMVGLQNGQVWATSTGSSTLVNLTSASFPPNPNGSVTNKFVGRAVIDPNNKNVGYVSFSYFAPSGQGIWKITNLVAASGAAPAAPVWTAAGNGIPSVPINGLVIDPLNSNILYAGTDIGVYVTTDAGATWTPHGTGLPRSAVFDVQIQPSFRILRAATHGRGVWEIPLISPGASTVQFSGSTAVNEGPGGAQGQVDATITVNRTGDTSFPATVNYTTADTAGANDCNNISGVGSARCDYIGTIGTLSFAANETSKNIVIPIVDDSYAEGPETFSVNLTSPTGSGTTLGSPASATVTINDDEALADRPNQIDMADFFVREHYIDFLNREPDASGYAFWINQINGCSPQPQCIEVRRINVSAAFFLSIEFQETGYLVERLYKVAYGDATGTSTTGGMHNLSVPIIRLNEFLPDTQKIGQGVVVNVGNWQQQLADNKEAFIEEFVQRPRFTTANAPTLTPAQFVDGLNTKAGNPLSQAERDQLVAELSGGMKTRAQVLRAVAEDSDLKSAEFNRAFVLMQYFGYLRRNPNDAPEAGLDYAGFEFWLGKLNQFNGNFVNAEMVKAFIISTEYKRRFGPS